MPGNPMQDILQMLMQQGGAGNMPAMQPGPQQAGGMGVAPMPMPAGEMPPMPPMPPGAPPPMSDDPVRDETEGELADVRSQMNGQMGDDEYEEGSNWEGDGTPSPRDLAKIKEAPTDGNLASFFQTFPDYMRELILSEGGNPSGSPDQYAMSDEDWEETQEGRSTQTDEK